MNSFYLFLLEFIRFHRIRICVVWFLVFNLASVSALAQNSFVVDTLWKTPIDKKLALQVMKSYSDTTTILAKRLESGNDSVVVYTIVGGTKQVSEFSFVGRAFRSLGPESTTDFLWETRKAQGDSQSVIMRTRAGKSDTVIDIGRGSSQGLPQAIIDDSRFYPHTGNRILLLFDVRDMFVKFTPSFTNVDHDALFTEIRLPDPLGNSCYVKWLFDYADTNILYVRADGKDFYNKDVDVEYSYTGDMGQTYERIPYDMPIGMGLFEPWYGIERVRLQTKRPLSTISFRHALTGELKQCYWRDNIIRDLVPMFDSTKLAVGLGWSWDVDATAMWGIGLHPDSREKIALVVLIDSLVDSNWVRKIGLTYTSDGGVSWTWLLKPGQSDSSASIRWIRLDPVTNNIVYSMNIKPVEADSVATDVVVRVRMLSTSANDPDSMDGAIVSVFPNPVSSDLFIKCDSCNVDSIEIFNSMGALVFEQAISNASAQTIRFDTGQVPNGLYVVKLKGPDSVHSNLVVVSH